MASHHRVPVSRVSIAITVAALLAGMLPAVATARDGGGGTDGRDQGNGRGRDAGAVFFVSDGLRQDLVAKYAAQRLMPTMADLLKKGTSATGNGLLTEAPPNTGAGWYSLATGAWPGVTGSTNNTFHINGASFGSRTGSFDAGVLQAETIAQSAERGGLKVAQVEWAGGRNATISGPTIDFQSFFSGRGVATNFTGAAGQTLFDDAAFIASFGLQFDHPAGYAGQAAFPAPPRPMPRVGPTCRPASARPRRCASGSSTSAWTSTASTHTSSTARTTAA